MGSEMCIRDRDEIAAKTAISDHHNDAKEGVAAFHEQREANFNDWLES